MPTVPGIIDDGNFRVAQRNGVKAASYPFFSRGDATAFVQPVPMRVDQRYWQKPVMMTQKNFDGMGIGYLVDISDPQVVYGTNLIDYDEIYASVPAKRTEYGQAPFNYNAPIIGISKAVLAFIDIFPGRFVYEYSAGTPLPILYRPLLLSVDYYQGEGKQIVQVGAYKNYLDGQNILTENSRTEIYLGKIYERLSIYVDLPTLSINPSQNPPP